MVTKSNKLQINEKREIERLIKCRRERERQHVMSKLYSEKRTIEKPYQDKIDKIKSDMEDAVKKAGLDKIETRGCIDTHPVLDKFDKETNEELVKLWERSE